MDSADILFDLLYVVVIAGAAYATWKLLELVIDLLPLDGSKKEERDSWTQR